MTTLRTTCSDRRRIGVVFYNRRETLSASIAIDAELRAITHYAREGMKDAMGVAKANAYEAALIDVCMACDAEEESVSDALVAITKQ